MAAMLAPPFDAAAAQKRSVCRFLENIIRNAELDADRVAALLKQLEYKPSTRSERAIPLDNNVPTGPAADMLLNLAAACRLRSWESAGLRSRLPSDLPSAADALAEAAKCITDNKETKSRNTIVLQVFRSMIDHFAQDGQETLRTDVVLNMNSGGGVLDRFAEFLWNIRHSQSQIGKERTDHGGTQQESR